MRIIPFVALLGCNSGQLDISPASLDFGEVDFQQELPDEGYNALDLVIDNTGVITLEVEVVGFPDERLIGTGLIDSTLDGGQATQLTVGVIGYDIEAGELTTVVSGTFYIRGDELLEDVPVDFSYTPVRDLGEDTAR